MKKAIVLIVVILLIILTLASYLVLSLQTSKGLQKENTNNIVIGGNTIYLSSMSLRQKIAQMIIVQGDEKENLDFTKINIGSIFLGEQETREDYILLINFYQNNSKIKLFVAADMEGYINPFKDFRLFTKFSEIRTREEAFSVGYEEGELMKKLGFNINFAPVSEFNDSVYGGRAFIGSQDEIKEKLVSYIRGLQENVFGTCKHYPGKGMIENTHISVDKQEISEKDLELFEVCIKNNISAIMVGHQIVSGEIDSDKNPASVSKQVIESLSNKNVLIISDEISMKALSSFYSNKADIYEDLINSGENMIIDLKLKPKPAYKLLLEIEEKVKNGQIDEYKINQSVKKILIAKGYDIQE
jgi:beta-N-acetylhexosaminidase